MSRKDVLDLLVVSGAVAGLVLALVCLVADVYIILSAGLGLW